MSVKSYAVGPILEQAVRWADTWAEAVDTAQFMADEYLIPYTAWSVRSQEPTLRGEHRQKATLYPTQKKRRRKNALIYP